MILQNRQIENNYKIDSMRESDDEDVSYLELLR